MAGGGRTAEVRRRTAARISRTVCVGLIVLFVDDAAPLLEAACDSLPRRSASRDREGLRINSERVVAICAKPLIVCICII